MFRADGANGQYIIMVPRMDLVVVITENVEDMQKTLTIVTDNLISKLKDS